MNVSAVLITLNEADNIEAALESVSWAAERVVVDAFSSDGTAEIARRCGARVIQREWKGYVEQKNFALSQAALPWVLSLDADERVTAALRDEILGLSPREGLCGFRIPRRTFFLKQWIRYTSWSPDFQVRLFDRRRAGWTGGRLHESVRLEGDGGSLLHPILHYSYRSVGDFIQRLDRYSLLAAEDCLEQGVRTGLRHLLLAPAGAFFKSCLLKQGYRDGMAGVAVSGLAAVSVFFRYLRLLELERAGSAPGSRGRAGRAADP